MAQSSLKGIIGREANCMRKGRDLRAGVEIEDKARN
jgi:hypothetical protein